MKFSSREDLDAPIDYVWQQVTDFVAFERQAMRRGADLCWEALGRVDPGRGRRSHDAAARDGGAHGQDHHADNGENGPRREAARRGLR